MAYADEVDELVEKIIDRAIEFFMYAHGWQLNFQGNYEREMGSDGVQITPPGKPERTSGGQVLGFGVPFVDGFEYGSGADAGTLVYRHFENTVRDMFRTWRNLPDPESFESYVEQLREAAWTVSMTSEGNTVSGVGNPALEAVAFLQKKIGGDDMNGATLCAEQEIWRKAREDVLTIAALFPTPIQPVLAGVATALPALGTLLNAGSTPNKTEVEFAGSTPDEVIGTAAAALKTLTDKIRDAEAHLERLITDAMETVTSHPSSFAMPKPKLLDLGDLNFLAVETLPQIARQFYVASDSLNGGAGCVHEWGRPAGINVSDSPDGPRAAWAALVSVAEDLVLDLGWEIKESATDLRSAAPPSG
ncbi:hypothetical protein AB0M83_24450 [Amycolatopsis sp. NPDC051106]|uniref:hypothetical protein n=1 Tax=unclassified Amycolatopsis TaxID=2618356 RepID=UPI0034202237